MKRLAAKRRVEMHPRGMQFLLDLPFIGVAIFDAKSREWVQFNDRFCAMTGYDRRELSQMNWRDICHPGDRAHCDAAFEGLASHRSRHARIVHRLIRRGGAVAHAEIDLSYATPRSGANNFIVALVAAPEDRDLVVENIRRRVAGETGSVHYEFRGRRKDGAAIEVGAHGSTALIRGRRVIVGVVQDITERRKAQRHVDEYLLKLETAMLGTVNSISRMVDLRDPYTSGHERRVGSIAGAMARELGMESERVRGLEIAGGLHDIGKIGAPSEILSKPTRLSAPEFALVKEHAVQGSDILKVVDFPWPVAEVAHQHHERTDGSGYPRGLKGDAILHEARIMAVADVIEAMASHRPYRASLGIGPALAEIESGAGNRYDPDCAAAALRLFRDKAYQLPA